MANSINLEEALECAVCLEVLSSENKVLPCQHTFCKSCLMQVKKAKKGQLECPECKLEITTEIDDLPSNIVLKRILDNLAGVNVTPKKKNEVDSLPAALSSPSCSYTDSQSLPITQNLASHLRTPSSDKKYGSHKIVPCTVEEVLRMICGLYDEGSIEVSNKIFLIGKLTNVQMEVDSCAKYDIDDGTSLEPLTVKCFENNLMFCDIASYIKVYGRITSYSNWKEFQAVNVQPLTDINELTTHMLEIVHNSIADSKTKLKNQYMLECLLSDSSYEDTMLQENKTTNKKAKRKLALDSSPNEELEPVLPMKKRRQRIKVLEDFSSETESDDDLPPLTSTARKGTKKVNISDDEIILQDDNNDFSSATEPLEEDRKILSENEMFSTPKNAFQISDRRSSDRIKKNQTRKFEMPSRSEVFNSIESSVSEESLDELKGRKIVNDWTRVTSRYNYDPNYTSDESMDSFIDDDFEYLDEESYVTEDSNYNSDDNKKSSSKRCYTNKIQKRGKSNSVTEIKGKDRRKTRKSNSITENKGKYRRKTTHESSSDFVTESDSNISGNKVKNKKVMHNQPMKESAEMSSSSSEDSLYSECFSDEMETVCKRKSSSKKMVKMNATKVRKNKRKFDEDGNFSKRKKDKKSISSSEDNSVDSDIGELSKSILSKVSERSRTMSDKKIKKQSVFDELKEKRAKRRK